MSHIETGVTCYIRAPEYQIHQSDDGSVAIWLGPIERSYRTMLFFPSDCAHENIAALHSILTRWLAAHQPIGAVAPIPAQPEPEPPSAA